MLRLCIARIPAPFVTRAFRRGRARPAIAPCCVSPYGLKNAGGPRAAVRLLPRQLSAQAKGATGASGGVAGAAAERTADRGALRCAGAVVGGWGGPCGAIVYVLRAATRATGGVDLRPVRGADVYDGVVYRCQLRVPRVCARSPAHSLDLLPQSLLVCVAVYCASGVRHLRVVLGAADVVSGRLVFAWIASRHAKQIGAIEDCATSAPSEIKIVWRVC